MLSTTSAGPFWRRALAALAHAFDPARDVDDDGAVFQTVSARERAKPSPDAESPPKPAQSPEETLQ